MKEVRCSDLGRRCGFVARAEDGAELLAILTDHSWSAHAVRRMPRADLERARRALREMD